MFRNQFSPFAIFKNFLLLPVCYPKYFFIFLVLLTGGLTSLLFSNRVNPLIQCKGFNYIDGDRQNANTVFVGERHDEYLKTIACVEEMTEHRGEHLVFLEGIPRGLEVDCVGKHFPENKKRRCIGWDSKGLVKSMQTDSHYKFNLQFLSELKDSSYGVPDEFQDQRIAKHFAPTYKEYEDLQKDFNPRNYPDNLPITFHYKEGDFLSKKLAVEMLNEIKDMREKGKTYEEIFQILEVKIRQYKPVHMLAKDHKPDELKKFQDLGHQRNKSMLKTIKEYEGFFKVVVAGHAHIVSLGGLFGNTAKEIEEEVYKDGQQGSYVRLITNNPYYEG